MASEVLVTLSVTIPDEGLPYYDDECPTADPHDWRWDELVTRAQGVTVEVADVVNIALDREAAIRELTDIRKAAGERGSNDDEHDLLMGYADSLENALGADAPARNPDDEW